MFGKFEQEELIMENFPQLVSRINDWIFTNKVRVINLETLHAQENDFKVIEYIRVWFFQDTPEPEIKQEVEKPKVFSKIQKQVEMEEPKINFNQRTSKRIPEPKRVQEVSKTKRPIVEDYQEHPKRVQRNEEEPIPIRMKKPIVEEYEEQPKRVQEVSKTKRAFVDEYEEPVPIRMKKQVIEEYEEQPKRVQRNDDSGFSKTKKQVEYEEQPKRIQRNEDEDENLKRNEERKKRMEEELRYNQELLRQNEGKLKMRYNEDMNQVEEKPKKLVEMDILDFLN